MSVCIEKTLLEQSYTMTYGFSPAIPAEVESCNSLKYLPWGPLYQKLTDFSFRSHMYSHCLQIKIQTANSFF